MGPLAPPLVAVAAGALYALGGRGRSRRRAREASFYGGLAVVVVALLGPIDTYAETLFAVHMLQHVLLLSVAPPLLVLGRPWPRIWMPFPPSVRAATARVATSRAGLLLARPAVALLLMSATLAAWHIPGLYDATVRHDSVHAVEHLSFVATALLFWAPVLGTPPLRTRLDRLRETAYLTLAMLPGWILAVVLAFSPSALYSAYVALPSRPGGLSALADQQLAAGVMWVPGSLPYLVALLLVFYRWLEPDPRPKELSWT